MALQKPEWFKVDPAKFLSDAEVDAMTAAELGACFRLLCRQWIDGYIPDDQRQVGRLARLDAAAMGEAWVTLCRFFPVVEPGKRANRFMFIEREQVVADLERRSDEGARAARKRWDEHRKKIDAAPNGSPMPDPMQEQSRAEQKESRPDQPNPVPRKRATKAKAPESLEEILGGGKGTPTWEAYWKLVGLFGPGKNPAPKTTAKLYAYAVVAFSPEHIHEKAQALARSVSAPQYLPQLAKWLEGEGYRNPDHTPTPHGGPDGTRSPQHRAAADAAWTQKLRERNAAAPAPEPDPGAAPLF